MTSTAQQALDRQYNTQQRKTVETISFNNRGLEGELDLSEYSQLKSLIFYDNKITKVNLTNNPKLTYLHLGNTQLSEIDLTNNSKLEHLILQGTPTFKQDMSTFKHLTQLKEIHVHGTKTYGSFRALTNLNQLTRINFINTNVDEDILQNAY
ncbi:MAG: leucine rich repeat protein [Mycoplasmataceae bacterium CE_OT135]|nr:MAG: leucine rich repeat protein [Mycoplasmataceae bacterium CE_OT135]KLL04079.1 MAG: leucine rich repeat protein [Mycoplasmataceae bacterium CE_OT135]